MPILNRMNLEPEVDCHLQLSIVIAESAPMQLRIIASLPGPGHWPWLKKMTTSNLAAKLKALQAGNLCDGTDATEGINIFKPSANGESSGDDEMVSKSQMVRNQLAKCDAFLDLKFSLQPLLNHANRLPRRLPTDYALLDECSKEAEALTRDFIQLQVAEMQNDTLLDDASVDEDIPALQALWQQINIIDGHLDPFLQESMELWHQKASNAGSGSKPALKALNQDPYQQVNLALQDMERLLKRANTHRQSLPRLGSKAPTKPVHPNHSGSEDEAEDQHETTQVFEDIYDDNDFFQALLRDWSASSLTNATSSITVSLPKQHRTGVDQRSSKGRKLRYDVHPKLVNYMVPQLEPNAWSDEKIDELFASLLGRNIV